MRIFPIRTVIKSRIVSINSLAGRVALTEEEKFYASSKSLLDGLYGGATIAEIDMIDLKYAIDVSTPIDLIVAYQNLMEGSKSHLRAFVRSMETLDYTYTPQYISQELYGAIIGL